MLEYAIAASIVLHVIAFAALQRVTARPEPAVATPGPISARLVEQALAATTPPVIPPARATSSSSDSVAAPALGPEIEPKPRPGPEPTPRARRRPRPDTTAGASTGAVPAPVPDRKTAASTPPSGVVASAAPRPPAAHAPAVDDDMVARYRQQLIGAARRYKRYPRAAMDNQWEGAAEVAMVVGANGRIVEMTISRSSGHAVLDRQAIDMFRKAKPLVPIPAALHGREFRVTLKVIYSLRDPGA